METIDPFYFALMILIVSTVFTIAWLMDALTHEKLVQVDITDKELQTHRLILICSFCMELSLIAMFWNAWLALPFFIASFITRTAHEFIDELTFHVHRCTKYESFLHLTMWISILAQTFLMFCWGFFANYQGVFDLPVLFYIWFGIIFVVMSYTSWEEWKR